MFCVEKGLCGGGAQSQGQDPLLVVSSCCQFAHRWASLFRWELLQPVVSAVGFQLQLLFFQLVCRTMPVCSCWPVQRGCVSRARSVHRDENDRTWAGCSRTIYCCL